MHIYLIIISAECYYYENFRRNRPVVSRGLFLDMFSGMAVRAEVQSSKMRRNSITWKRQQRTRSYSRFKYFCAIIGMSPMINLRLHRLTPLVHLSFSLYGEPSPLQSTRMPQVRAPGLFCLTRYSHIYTADVRAIGPILGV